jgi:glutathione synthase
VGGTAVKAEIDDADKHIIRTLAPRLRQDGLWFVGIDVIGGKLTEVNVTSPTGIQSMERLDKLPLSDRVIEWVENKARHVG